MNLIGWKKSAPCFVPIDLKENIPIKISAPARGYGKLFFNHVMQAPQGVDFDFLAGVDTES